MADLIVILLTKLTGGFHLRAHIPLLPVLFSEGKVVLGTGMAFACSCVLRALNIEMFCRQKDF